jgi:hypothetical protein
VDFSDALRAVKAGRRVRRALWAELDGRIGSWVELILTDQVGEVLACPVTEPDGSVVMASWGRSDQDILAEDWEDWEIAG